MAQKEIRNLKDLSQQQVHQGEILIKYLAENYSTVLQYGTLLLLAQESLTAVGIQRLSEAVGLY